MAHILVIEADQPLREAIATILELAGHHITTAADGPTGVVSLFNHRPDLVLCAMNLPYVDGYGILHILRKNRDTEHVPLIFSTAHLAKVDMRRGAELGATGYLIVPFEERELLSAVNNALNL